MVKAEIEPINKSFDTKLVELYSMENITIKIKEAKSSIKSSETKHFSQDLKMEDVELRLKVKIAKGEISIKTLSKTYLIAYIKVKFKKPSRYNCFYNSINRKYIGIVFFN